jgi:hypothetical protein
MHFWPCENKFLSFNNQIVEGGVSLSNTVMCSWCLTFKYYENFYRFFLS